MATESEPTFLKGVYLFTQSNNISHRTSEITSEKLIVRRGQSFIVSVRLREAFNPALNSITITAKTGEDPQEDRGTSSSFVITLDRTYEQTPPEKVVWKAHMMRYSLFRRGIVTFFITPPANCPIGRYKLTIKYKDEETHLADLVVLFNPWCDDDAVFLPFERKRKEYVLNEQGVVYRGSSYYIMPLEWNYAQFEEDMVDISMMILDKSHSHKKDPVDDVASRGDPAYVGRVLTAMINNLDDDGVLEGNWSGSYEDGKSPSHWSSSHPILSKWYNSECQSVKYGQCWVFACVMCSVMRLLGIPCRVVSNFVSAHDTDRNLTIDSYVDENGAEARHSPDSIWNFHVWVEGWFTRPDLSKTGLYDGWQVLDPTPQETSGGIFRCGPCPVKGIKTGETALTFDMPFVYAEVNADEVTWVVMGEDRTKLQKTETNTKKVGQKISTKAVGLQRRRDITHTYKYKEGSKKERESFSHAMTRDYSRVDEYEDEYEDEEDSEDEVDDPVDPVVDDTPPPEVSLRFEEKKQPINGKDVEMRLVMHSESSVPRELSINISVQAMRYNGTPSANIQREKIFKTLQPGQDLTFPISIPYSAYRKHMVTSESLRIDALVMEKDVPEHTYLAECDVVLLDPEITIKVTEEFKLDRKSKVEVVFDNPIEDTLTNCSLSVSGSGLLHDEFECKLPDLNPEARVRVKLFFVPYKIGEKTLLVDFDCSQFRDIKASAVIPVNL